MRIFIQFLLTSLIFASFASSEAGTLRIGTHIAPPYQYLSGNEITGRVFDVLSCALIESGTEFRVRIFPPRRGETLVLSNDIDFLFSKEAATLFRGEYDSSPLVLEKWYWYSNRREDILPSSQVGTVAGSNQEQWLEKQGYTNVEVAYSVESLAKMLRFGRVDHILVDESRFNFQLRSLEGTSYTPIKRFLRFSVLNGVFSESFFQNNLELVKVINQNILNCNPVGLELDFTTLELLLRSARDLEAVLNESEFLTLLELELLSIDTVHGNSISSLDLEWRSSGNNRSAFVNLILSNELSTFLRKKIEIAAPYVTEVFVTDRLGRTLGASRMTSDYWHGDEPSVQGLIEIPSEPFIQPIYYDLSTKRFQTQISMPILDEGKLIAIMVVGVDIETLFQANQ